MRDSHLLCFATGLLLAGILMLISSCNKMSKPSKGPQEINLNTTKSRLAHIYDAVSTTPGGHSDIIFRYKNTNHAAQDGMIGVVHDPDCKCKNAD